MPLHPLPSQVSPRTAEGHRYSRLPMQMRLTEDGTPYRPRRYPGRLDGRPVPPSPQDPIR